MKFGQLIEYNMGKHFLENSQAKFLIFTHTRPFLETSNLSTSLNQQREGSCSLFLQYVKVEHYQKILKLRC